MCARTATPRRLATALCGWALGLGACQAPETVTVPAATTTATRLAITTPGDPTLPTWSPSGFELAFIDHQVSVGYDLLRLAPGGQATVLAPNFNEAGDLAAPLAGNAIFTHSVPFETGQLWRFDLDTGVRSPVPGQPPPGNAWVWLAADAAGERLLGIVTEPGGANLAFADATGLVLAQIAVADPSWPAALAPEGRRAARAHRQGNAWSVILMDSTLAATDTLATPRFTTLSGIAWAAGEALVLAGTGASGGTVEWRPLAGGAARPLAVTAPRAPVATAGGAAVLGRSGGVDILYRIDRASWTVADSTTVAGTAGTLAAIEQDALLFSRRLPERRTLATVTEAGGAATAWSPATALKGVRPAWAPERRQLAAVTAADELVVFLEPGATPDTVLAEPSGTIAAVTWPTPERLALVTATSSSSNFLEVSLAGQILRTLELPITGTVDLVPSGGRFWLSASPETLGARQLLALDPATGQLEAQSLNALEIAAFDRSTVGHVAFSTVFDDGIFLGGPLTQLPRRLSAFGRAPALAPNASALVFVHDHGLYRAPFLERLDVD